MGGCCGKGNTQMRTPHAEATKQEGFVAMDYQGTNQGSITFVNQARGSDALVYRGSASRGGVYAHPDDVVYLEVSGRWKRAPEPKQAKAKEAAGPTPLTDLDLSKTALDGLADANITTLEQAQSLSDMSLDSIPGVGDAAISTIKKGGK